MRVGVLGGGVGCDAVGRGVVWRFVSIGWMNE